MTRFHLEDSINATLVGRDGRDLEEGMLAAGTLVEILGPGAVGFDGGPSTLLHAWHPEDGSGPYLYRTWEWPKMGMEANDG